MKAVYGFAALLATGLLLTAAPARADGFVSPTIGVDFGGNAGDTLRGAANNSNKINFGASAGWRISESPQSMNAGYSRQKSV